MQQNKGKKNISEIQTYCSNSSKLVLTFKDLLGVFNLSYINSLFSKSKTKGVDGKQIFQILFSLSFLDLKNIEQLRLSGYFGELNFKKDVLYDFMKNPLIDWRKIVQLLCKQVVKIIIKESDPEANTSQKFLIIDDSLLSKSGKRIEFVGKVFDHCTHSYNLGIKLLTLGLCDGKSFLPVDFSLHNEPGKTKKRGLQTKELKKQFSKQRKEDSAGFKRTVEVSKDKVSTALSMVRTAISKGVQADYVLVDSWFTSEKFITEIHKIKANLFVIGLMKTNRIVSIEDKKNKANLVPELRRKQIKYSKKLKCHYLTKEINYKGIPLRAYWIKMNGQQTWKMLISSDIKLTFIKAMKYYQIRWSIEVFFKDCKQNLGLNACQSTDFDANIAHISIVFMNYMVLSLKKRIDDYETIGALFRNVKEILLEKTLIEKIWKLFTEVFSKFLSELGIDWNIFIKKFIDEKQVFDNQIKNAFQCLFSINTTNQLL